MLNTGTPGSNTKFSDYYEYVRTLGRGAFGAVVQAVDKRSGEGVAVKILPKKSVKSEHTARLRKEASILAALNHPNIVQYKGLRETQQQLLLVMEVVHGVSLTEYMQTQPVSPGNARHIIRSILEAVNYCHGQGIIHRDLKPDNILVDTSSREVKVADFGLSTQQHSPYRQPIDNERCGTLLFMPPEQRSGAYYTNSVDVWSCGVILFMLLTGGMHPCASTQDEPCMVNGVFVRFPSVVPVQAQDLILKMTQKASLCRLTASEALRHPWVTKSRAKASMFEELEQYSDEIKLKNVLFALAFSSLLIPIRTKPRPLQRPVHVPNHSLELSRNQKVCHSRLILNHKSQRRRGLTLIGPGKSAAKLNPPRPLELKRGLSKSRVSLVMQSHRSIFRKR